MAKVKVNKEGHIICPSGHDMGHIENILYEGTRDKEVKDMFDDISRTYEDFTDGSFVHYKMGYSTIGCALFMTRDEQMAQLQRSRHANSNEHIKVFKESKLHNPHFLELSTFVCECKQCGAKVQLKPEVKLSSILVADYSGKIIKDHQVKDNKKHGWARGPEDIRNRSSTPEE